MGDRMTPIPFGNLMEWAVTEKKRQGHVFGVRKFYTADTTKSLPIFEERMETPFGPAAGPNTQLAQNIIAAYLTGSRFFELKTVQILDGEDLPVNKPCILAEDECYNCEWSTELYVPQAYEEYVKAWVALKALSVEWGLGSQDGFVFNISVGYDLAGIQSEKIDTFLNDMTEAKDHPIFQECMQWLLDHIDEFEVLTRDDVERIPSRICSSATVSTLHGCPPQEIEGIASYLMTKKGLHTFVKCNPTLLGYEEARKIMDDMGYDYVAFGEFHFQDDLQFEDAVPMLSRLAALAKEKGLEFGVKITNTFPVDVTRKELPSEEMYMSGKALCALSLSVALKLSEAFRGKLRISYSGGADYFNVGQIFTLGIWPITAATTLLKPGGYNRIFQIAEKLSAMEYRPFGGVDVEGLRKLVASIQEDPHHVKPIKPLPRRKTEDQVPLLNCFLAPCTEGCPIHQDIPAYLKLVQQEKYQEALTVILDKNPLPFMTGTLCNHRCMGFCTRNFYEEPVQIRKAKKKAAEEGYEKVLPNLKRKNGSGIKVAIVGAGPAGIACAAFLAREGADVTVFEKEEHLGGTVRNIIPDFRISAEDVNRDVSLAQAWGAVFVTGKEITSLQELQAQGFEKIVLAVGAHQGIHLGIETESEMKAGDFLAKARKDMSSLNLGSHVAVIGAGNTAMDAARMAKRLKGTTDVTIVYRRTKRYMPAEEEELKEAMAEGVVMKELLAPVRQKDGMLLCHKVLLGEPDESGRQTPVETQEEVTIPADTIIASLGEKPDVSWYETLGLPRTETGTLVLNHETMETGLPGVYVIGDGAIKASTIVMAIRDAKAAADHMLSLPAKEPIPYETKLSEAEAKRGVLVHACKERPEGERCLECSHICENCVDVCPNRANVSVRVPGLAMPAILHVDYMCNECGNCKSFCPYSSAPYQEKFTLFANEEDFQNSKNDGYVMLHRESLQVLYRLGTSVKAVSLKEEPEGIYEGLRAVIEAVDQSYDYLYLNQSRS